MANKKLKKTKKKKGKDSIKRGRPTRFPEIMKLLPGIKAALQMGHTERDTCEMFNVPVSTFEKYKTESPELVEQIRQAKLKADETVVNALYKKAVGYEIEEKTYEFKAGSETKTNTVKNLKKVVKKEIAPDVHAGIFWLKNRMPKVWKDKQELDVSNPDGSLSPDRIIVNLIPTMPKNAPKQ